MQFRIILINIFIFFISGTYSLYAQEKILKPDDILSAIKSSDNNKISSVMLYIKNTKPTDILPHLQYLLISDETESAVVNTITAMSFFEYNITLPYCISVLEKTNSEISRKAVITYLGKSNERKAVLHLAKELGNPVFEIRETAIIALKTLGDDRMFPEVLGMLLNENPVMRLYALQAIYQMYDLRFFNHLTNMLKDENKSVRYYTLKCIEKNSLSDALKFVRKTATSDDNIEVRALATEILGTLNDKEGLSVLHQCLADNNAAIRLSAAQSVNMLLQPASAGVVSSRLSEETEYEIKKILIITLGLLKNSGGYKGLNKIINEDKNTELRIRACYALGQINEKKSETLLAAALKDKSYEVRAEACNALSVFKTREITLALLDVLNNDNAVYVRTAALYSLISIGGKSVILPLFEQYRIENNSFIKNKLAVSLARLIKENI